MEENSIAGKPHGGMLCDDLGIRNFCSCPQKMSQGLAKSVGKGPAYDIGTGWISTSC